MIVQIPSISSWVYYTYINPIIYVTYKINFSLDPIKIRHICLDHSTFRMMRKLLSILLVTTQYEPLNFSKKFKNIYVTLYANLWTIKILYNAHLCIYNVVLSVCLTHKVPQICQTHCSNSSIQILQFRANDPGHGI